MYINDTFIGFYLIAAIVGLAVGQFTDWMNNRLQEKQKIFSRDIFRKYKIEFKPNYILMIITAVIYVGLVYKFGIQETFIGNLGLIKYITFTPLIISAFVVDYRKQIIPNRLNLTIFEIGIIFAFLYGFSNVAITIDMLLGMVVGGGIFFIIMLIGKLLYGKQGMGFGDIKLMIAIGLYFGLTNTVIISIISFLLGAVWAIGLMLFRKKKNNEYIAFGPFIAISAFISIFVPVEILLSIVMNILTLGMYKK